MDAKELYKEWCNFQNTQKIIDIIEKPISSGGFDIKGIENVSLSFEFNGNVLQGFLKFKKGLNFYSLLLIDIKEINNTLCNVKSTLILSIENGANNLVLLIKENDTIEPLLNITFVSGGFSDVINEKEVICKF